MKKSVARQSPSCQMPFACAALLLDWYDRHRRLMPWRALPNQKADPYKVWLSEIMLQQTTVITVGPYFEKFVRKWPTLQALAKAPLDDVMKMWAGLGYYRRAKGLHDCALEIMRDWKGNFPDHYDDLLTLSGIGPYTAAAITAIAFDKKANVVDGNVERVVTRLFAVTDPMPKAKNKVRDLAASLLPSKRFGDYAQAMMDLGATLCIPQNPKCDLCPLAQFCVAHEKGIEASLPQREKKKAKPTRRALAFVIVNKRNELFLRTRGKTGLLANMSEVPSSLWQEKGFPSFSTALDDARLTRKIPFKRVSGLVTHVFTHFNLEIQVFLGRFSMKPAGGRWVALEKLEEEALPSVMRKIIRHGIKELHRVSPSGVAAL